MPYRVWLTFPALALAFASLAAIGGDRATTALANCLQDDDFIVRAEAVSGLSKMGWEPADKNERIRFHIQAGKWKKAARIAPAATYFGGNEVGGPFVEDTPIPLDTLRENCIPWIEFSNADGGLRATIELSYLNGLGEFWLAELQLLDAGGALVGRRKTYIDKRPVGHWIWSFPSRVEFVFGSETRLSRAARFRLRFTPIPIGEPLFVQGARILQDCLDRTGFHYVPKCDKCGAEYGWGNYIEIAQRGKSVREDFVCSRCGHWQRVVIRIE